MFKLKDYRDAEKSFGDLLGWFALVADGVVETTTGHFLASWYFKGEDLASSTTGELESLSARVNAILCQLLDERWAIHVDGMRSHTTGYPERGAFPDRATYVIDEERRQVYESETNHFATHHAITLCWEIPNLAGANVSAFMYGDTSSAQDAATHKDRMLAKFNEKCADIEAALRPVIALRRMLSYQLDNDPFGRPNVFDEQLEYFEFCATSVRRKVKLPPIPLYLDRAIGAKGLQVEPLIGNVGFGSANVVRIGTDRIVRTLTVTGYPDGTQPAALAVLDRLPFEYRWNTRFIIMSQERAERVLNASRRKWHQKRKKLVDQLRSNPGAVIDQDADDMVRDVDGALTELKSNLVKYGHYTSAIVLVERVVGGRAEDVRSAQLKLDEKAKEVRAALQGIGYEVADEDINNADAFIGTMPGNLVANVRGAPLHTLNLADLLPLTSAWAGHEAHPNPLYPPNSPPLFYGATSGSTPFMVCPFVDDVGHHLIIGPTGAGKTTLLNLEIAQHFRYPNARVFGFDRKNGAYTLCKAAGGDYYDIGGADRGLRFCPLAGVHDPSELQWAAEWLETLVLLQGIEMTPARRNAITEALRRMAGNLHGRSLTDFRALVQDEDMRSALDYYTLSGPMGELLDATEDTLRESRFMMFEMEHLAQMGEKVAVPVLLYLFHVMEKRLDGVSPTFVPCDESWLMFTHPLFRAKLTLWLKTWRSKLANVALATQEPSDVLESPIRDVVLASCPVRILLPNPDAAGVQRRMYELMGCNDKMIDMISHATKKRDYYYASADGRRMFTLALGAVALSFVGATGTAAATKVRQLEAEFGELWPAEWLRQRGLPDWANFYEGLRL